MKKVCLVLFFVFITFSMSEKPVFAFFLSEATIMLVDKNIRALNVQGSGLKFYSGSCAGEPLMYKMGSYEGLTTYTFPAPSLTWKGWPGKEETEICAVFEPTGEAGTVTVRRVNQENGIPSSLVLMKSNVQVKERSCQDRYWELFETCGNRCDPSGKLTQFSSSSPTGRCFERCFASQGCKP